MNKALYAGTFDPITLGHQDIIRRAAAICERLYVGVAIGHHKNTLFSLDERTEMVQQVITDLNLSERVQVIAYDGLLVELCQQENIKLIIRGARSVSDFEYEHRLAAMNRHLAADIETLIMLPSERYAFISSTLVRECAKLGGDISALLPPIAQEKLINKLGNKKNSV